MYEYRCTVLSVVDGDTIHAQVDLGCDVQVKMTVRLAGLNAPEISTPEGKTAKVFVWQWVGVGTGFTLRTSKDKREKYGRYLGTLYRDGDPQSLNYWLLANGYAVPYDGGAR